MDEQLFKILRSFQFYLSFPLFFVLYFLFFFFVQQAGMDECGKGSWSVYNILVIFFSHVFYLFLYNFYFSYFIFHLFSVFFMFIRFLSRLCSSCSFQLSFPLFYVLYHYFISLVFSWGKKKTTKTTKFMDCSHDFLVFLSLSSFFLHFPYFLCMPLLSS